MRRCPLSAAKNTPSAPALLSQLLTRSKKLLIAARLSTGRARGSGIISAIAATVVAEQESYNSKKFHVNEP